MSIPNSGPISFSALQTEFGGTNPISLSEYYRNGGLVPDSAVNAGIPTSGAISLEQFRGTGISTTVTYEIIGGGGGAGAGRTDDGGAGQGLFATSGGTSSISGSGITTVTAAGGTGGVSYAFVYNSPLGAGEASFYGPGGARVNNQQNGLDAPATSYGAGGSGGGGDAPSTFDSSGNRGEGGFAGTRKTGTLTVVYGTTLTATVGAKGVGHKVRFTGGDGATGYIKLTWDNKVVTFTASGTVVIN